MKFKIAAEEILRVAELIKAQAGAPGGCRKDAVFVLESEAADEIEEIVEYVHPSVAPTLTIQDILGMPYCRSKVNFYQPRRVRAFKLEIDATIDSVLRKKGTVFVEFVSLAAPDDPAQNTWCQFEQADFDRHYSLVDETAEQRLAHIEIPIDTLKAAAQAGSFSARGVMMLTPDEFHCVYA